MSHTRFICLLIAGLAVASCQSDRWDVDTTEVEYNPSFTRLDSAIFGIDPNNAASAIQELTASQGPFVDVYLQDIMQVGPASNPMSAELLMRFTTDPMWEELQQIIETVHSSLVADEVALGEAFRRYAVHFSADTLPKLIAYNSGFNVGIFPTNEYLGIGLEWYSGSDFDIIKQLPPDLFPQYKRDKMQPGYLEGNALKGWLYFKYQDELKGQDLLARMVFAGKVLYTAQALMDGVEERVLLNYTEAELAWCREQEYDVWKHFVETDALFGKDQMAINKLMADGPFTPGMPPESPGGVGTWVGYRMAQAYMEKHPDATLPELMMHKDEKAFLKFYKPGR